MIKFLQHSSERYPPRTFENASADATIAFAFDFNTPGERLTKEAVDTQNKIYIPVKSSQANTDLKIKIVASRLTDGRVTTLNIAGNQLATCLKYGHTQEMVDSMVYDFLLKVFTHFVYEPNLKLVRSGGQSGFDEAGLKAAEAIGLPALCLCPQGWKFNDATGKAICNERLFKNRFASNFIA